MSFANSFIVKKISKWKNQAGINLKDLTTTSTSFPLDGAKPFICHKLRINFSFPLVTLCPT
jgi:hypothetical protein